MNPSDLAHKEPFRWYVIRAVSGQEKKVKNYLENEIQRQGYKQSVTQILVPIEKVYEMRNGKKRLKEKSFFPGYIMIYADLSDPELVFKLNNVPGVVSFLSTRDNNRTPIPLRKAEVSRILGKMNAEEESGEEEIQHHFIIGESVKIMEGPFSGFTGNIENINTEKSKIRVMVKIFSRNTPIELGFFQVEKQS